MEPAARRHRQHFLARFDAAEGVLALFDHLPDVVLFAKDTDLRFVFVNRAFLHLVDVKSEDDVLGRRDVDFFPREMADNYVRDDRAVLGGDSVVDRVELIRNPDGSIDWFTTTKVPLKGRDGSIVGVCGITRDLKKMHSM